MVQYIKMVDKRLQAVFYCGDRGAEPVRDWLKKLSKRDRFLIGADLKTVEYGWPIGMPTCRPMGGGLFEVRTNLKNRIARVLFCVSGAKMILLHGFIKKTQQTSKQDLDLAKRRKHKLGALK